MGKVVRQVHHERERLFDRFTTNGKGCSTGSPRTGKVVRQAHHEWERLFDRFTTNGSIKIPFTLSRELAERSKGVFGVLQEAL
jgi:hypothetical protein